jgi:malonyl CoA-acyl carrier protein transacylase
MQADDKFADYAPKTAFLFPGQGAQTVGMAKVRILSAQSSMIKELTPQEPQNSLSGHAGALRYL